MVSNTDQPMKSTPQKDPVNSLDEVEDLTLFADESFDTVDIDLFEFTGEEESPLTRLKSIILSLDWEISDDILQELADEIVELQQVWEGDKVAQVYLQGLDKIGRYLRDEGAYAHPNAIKLLLTFFYDFEKIVSSPDMNGEEISILLKTDVRKFKILQYQISQLEAAGTNESPEMGNLDKDALSLSGQEPLTRLKATILGLEWEVTDNGLDKFREQVGQLTESVKDDKAALVLLQGLGVLGNYIADEKADAHPEAFILLHSFYKGLERLLKDENLGDQERQEILVSQVERLNNLKALIAAGGTAVTEEVGRKIESTPVALEDVEPGDKAVPDIEEEEPLFASMESEEEEEDELTEDLDNTLMAFFEEVSEEEEERAEEDGFDDLLDPEAIQPIADEVADDFLGEELGGDEVTAALSGLDVPEKLEERDDISPQEHIEEQLDLLFSDDSEEDFASLDTQTFELDDKNADELGLDLNGDVEEQLEDLPSALSLDDLEEAATEKKPGEAVVEDIDLQLDSVFSDEDDTTEEIMPALSSVTPDEDEEREVDTEARLPADELAQHLDSFFDESSVEEADEDGTKTISTEGDTAQSELAFDESVTPALSDVAEDVAEEQDLNFDSEAAKKLEERLDRFFGSDTDTDVEAPVQTGAEPDKTDEEEAEDDFFQDGAVIPALADEDVLPPAGEMENAESIEEIEKSLDTLFDQAAGEVAEEPVDGEPADEEEEELDLALSEESIGGIEERLDSLLSSSEEDEIEPVVAETDLPDVDFGELESPAAEEQEEDESDTVEPALAAVEPEDELLTESGRTETPADAVDVDMEEELGGEVEEDDDTPTVELEEKLNFFFPDQEAESAESAAAEMETETAAALEAEEPVDSDDQSTRKEHLQALGSAIAGFGSTPREEFVDQTTNIIQVQQQYIEDTTQKVLLTLMNTVVTSIPRDYDAAVGEGTEELMDYLYQRLKDPGQGSETLVEAVTRFTTWHQNLLADILRQNTSAPGSEEQEPAPAARPAEEKTVPEQKAAASPDAEEDRLLRLMRSEFAEIRSALKKEIETLKKELTS